MRINAEIAHVAMVSCANVAPALSATAQASVFDVSPQTQLLVFDVSL
jgi:hypothetical protein